MLNVTCGDIAAENLRRAGIEGPVLPWRDVLHEGPVPSDVTDRELREIRAGFISSCGWGSYRDVLGFFEERDNLVARAAREGAALWFEADLVDQLQLLEVVSQLAQAGASPEQVLVFGADGFEELGRETLTARLRLLGAPGMAAALEAWRAFRSPDPRALLRLGGTDLPGLPYVGQAIGRFLEEYPSPAGGLSRLERTLLEAASTGPVDGAQLFRAVSAREERPFLGDWACWLVLSRLLGGRMPALAGDGSPFPERLLELTDAGRMILSGDVDWMQAGGQGRWLGGVRLDEGQDWRYDTNTALLARMDGRGAEQ